MTKGWSIVCDARRGKDLGIRILALVDRRVQTNRWWTSDESAAVAVWRDRDTAEKVCSRFAQNNCRVVRAADAVSVIAEQAERIVEKAIDA